MKMFCGISQTEPEAVRKKLVQGLEKNLSAFNEKCPRYFRQ
jgi:hypothetical protein